jgi:NTE family protein
MPDRSGVTLVCGGGGVWGVAWMTGLIMGLAEAGVDVRRADAFVGTSAGSVICAQFTTELSTEFLFERQVDPAKQPRERAPAEGVLPRMSEVMRRTWPGGDRERLAALRDLALEAPTISVAQRRADIVERLGLPADRWPAKPISLTGVDVETLELCVFDAQCGVSIIDAVTASCAVPGVWPPASFGGRRYLDGGVWKTADNAHLAKGAEAVLILSPTGGLSGMLGGGSGLAADIAALEAAGAAVGVIYADEDSLRAMVPNPLDPSTRTPAAEAGRLQGAREAEVAKRIFGLA